MVFAYRTSIKIATIEKHFFTDCESNLRLPFIYVLRILKSDCQDTSKSFGVVVWVDRGVLPLSFTTLSPLSDFYYRLIQNSYYFLGARDYDLNDVGCHLNEYMTWGTYPNKYTERDG